MTALTYGKDTYGEFVVSFGACVLAPLSWKEEVYAAAIAIANRAKKPIWVCSSGGIDSEVVCRAFYDQGINFSVLTLSHIGGTNRHDMHYAATWCAERGINHKIIEFDVQKFLSSEIERYTEKYRLIHPFRYLQLKLMETVEEMGGFAVLGGGEQTYQADKSKESLSRDDVYLEFSNSGMAPLRWCEENRVDHEPYFFFSTPEVCLSYMRIPIVDFALHHPDPIFRHSSNTYSLKRMAYQSIWIDLKHRNKFHGFEAVVEPYRAATWSLRERFSGDYQVYHLPIPEFERQLLSA